MGWWRATALAVTTGFCVWTASATALAAEATPDTVHLTNGGRLRGTVSEEDPRTGVKIVLADGSVRSVPAADVRRVEYGSDAASAAPAPAPGSCACPPGASTGTVLLPSGATVACTCAAPAFYGPGGVAPAQGGPAAYPERVPTGETKGIKGLYIAGPIVLGVAWIATIGVTAGVAAERDKGEATAYACIPVAGPWVMLGSNLKTDDYVAPLVVSGVLQGSGLLMTILGVAIRRPVYRTAEATIAPYASSREVGVVGRF